jgi:hypothetical protein
MIVCGKYDFVFFCQCVENDYQYRQAGVKSVG